MDFNVYIDGSWLFSQCGANGIFANRMEFPDSPFRIDFSRFLEVVVAQLDERLASAGSTQAVTPTRLYIYTAIIRVPAEPDPEWGDIEFIRRNSVARRYFADAALAAGFSNAGVFDVPLTGWLVDKLRDRRYQEKMVDTSLVARLVEQAIGDPARLHVLISGDLDMLPAIRTVVPSYTETVVLATTHPDQYERGQAQSAFKLNQFPFRYEPLYLERFVKDFVAGTHIYQCSNARCGRVFVRTRAIPIRSNPLCKPCNDARVASA